MITATGLDKKTRTYKGTTSTELNQAIGHQGNILLDSETTYKTTDSLTLPSNTTLDGNGSTLKLAKGLPIWGGRNASISQKKAMLMILNNSGNNITVKNLTVDGSQADYYPNVRLGTSCYNLATLIGGNGITFENCTFKNSCNDALLLSSCGNIKIDHIKVDKCGHDGIYCYRDSNVNVTNSEFINRTNCSCRFDTVNGGTYLNNTSTTSGGGGAGLQFQGTVKNVTVKGNTFTGLPYPGIWKYSGTLTNVLIENNTVIRCKSPGISASGATLRNNKIYST